MEISKILGHKGREVYSVRPADPIATAIALFATKKIGAAVVTCPPTASVGDVVALMDANRIRHIPVAEDGAAIGVISMRDVVAVRLSQLELDIEVLREQLVTGAK